MYQACPFSSSAVFTGKCIVPIVWAKITTAAILATRCLPEQV